MGAPWTSSPVTNSTPREASKGNGETYQTLASLAKDELHPPFPWPTATETLQTAGGHPGRARSRSYVGPPRSGSSKSTVFQAPSPGPLPSFWLLPTSLTLQVLLLLFVQGARGAPAHPAAVSWAPLSEVNTPLFPTTSQVPQLRGHPGSKVTCRARVLQGQPPGIQSQSTVLGCVHVGHLLPTLPCPLPRLPHPASVSSRFPWAKFPRTGGFCRGCPRVRVEKKDLAGLGGWMKGRHLAAHESNC